MEKAQEICADIRNFIARKKAVDLCLQEMIAESESGSSFSPERRARKVKKILYALHEKGGKNLQRSFAPYLKTLIYGSYCSQLF